jgi:hypothetical protein
MIPVTCLCGRQFQVEDQFAGRPVRCPACGVRQVALEPAADTKGKPPDYHAGEAEETAPRRAGPRTSGVAIASLMMGLISLLCGFLMFLGIPAMITGLVAMRRINRSEGRQTGKGLAIAGMVTGALSTLLMLSVAPVAGYFAWRAMWDQAAWVESAHNLRLIDQAMANYHDVNHCWPPQATVVPFRPDLPFNPGEPPPLALSWRVHLLPFLEYETLWQQFNQDEPWDSPQNRGLSSQLVKVYQMPRDTSVPANYTFYQVFYSDQQKYPRAVFLGPQPGFVEPHLPQRGPRIPDISDGTSNTILIVEAATAVPWAKPADIFFDPDQPPPPLGSHFERGTQVMTADGKIHALPKTMSPTTIKELITRDGGEMNNIPDW